MRLSKPAVILAAIVLSASSSASVRAEEPSAAMEMSRSGPEQQALEKLTGEWDVVASLWPAPGAEPIVQRGLIAERKMIGPILQETMKPASGSSMPDFTRIDYLNFDRVEGRWKYVSMDTRFPVSIMPARSFGPAHDGTIDVQFEPQGFVGFGTEVEGRFMVSDMAISTPDVDHGLKEQHVMMANGTGKSWLFVRYEYSRRR
jgi:hypothetical protein